MSPGSDAPYPELKKTHTMARTGRPFTDYKPPAAAPVWDAIGGLGRYHVLLAAVQLGVFEALAEPRAEPQAEPRAEARAEPLAEPSSATGGELDGSTAADLAERLGLSSPHLEALLDSVVALGLLDRIGGTRSDTDRTRSDTDRTRSDTDRTGGAGVYRLNDTARRYLLDDGAASMTGLVGVAPGPHQNWTRLAETVKTGRPLTPIDHRPADFYVPLVEGTFTTMRRCAVRADRHMRYSALAAPRILDLGAGGAPWTIAVLEACPRGRAVVNDLPGVIDVARRKTAEHQVTDRCEFRPGDFHAIPLEDNHYDIVVLGHVCRTEGPSGARRLVERSLAALRPEGQLVLADYFIGPDRKSNPHAVLMGATMMASTINGFAVTNEAACEWLRGAGFEAIRLVEPIGFQFAYLASKPRRPPRPSRDGNNTL